MCRSYFNNHSIFDHCNIVPPTLVTCMVIEIGSIPITIKQPNLIQIFASNTYFELPINFPYEYEAFGCRLVEQDHPPCKSIVTTFSVSLLVSPEMSSYSTHAIYLLCPPVYPIRKLAAEGVPPSFLRLSTPHIQIVGAVMVLTESVSVSLLI